MPSDREASNPAWRRASKAWNAVRTRAAQLERAGEFVKASDLMARAEQALRQVAGIPEQGSVR